MRADGHAGPAQLPYPVLVQPARLPEEPHRDEELGRQPPLQQPGQGYLDIGRISVVEGNPDIIAPNGRVKHHFELCAADPGRILTRFQRANGSTDPVHSEDDDGGRKDKPQSIHRSFISAESLARSSSVATMWAEHR